MLLSQVPPHFTKATLRMLSPAFCPMILAIFAATASPLPGSHLPEPLRLQSPLPSHHILHIRSRRSYFRKLFSLPAVLFHQFLLQIFSLPIQGKSRSSPVPPTITAAKYDLHAHPPLLLPISDWKIQRNAIAIRQAVKEERSVIL